MRKLIMLAVCGALFVSATAMADEPKAAAPAAAAPGGAKYGPAGCGLGSMVFAPNSGITQIFAATTNGTSANQTFGITTGTSNCADSGGGEKSAKAFIETNREALAKDIARGNGETVSSLSTLAGCPNSAAVGVSLQRNFKGIFPAASVSNEQVSSSVIATLKADKSLACSI